MKAKLDALKEIVGNDLFYRLIERYNLGHLLEEGAKVSRSDIHALLIGVVVNVTAQDLQDNEKLRYFFYDLTKRCEKWKLKKNQKKNKNKNLRMDIKKIEKIQIAKTYEEAEPFKTAVTDETKQKELKSALYLAKDLAYRNFNDQSVIRILDPDGERRLYVVHNIANSKGLVCTALAPYFPPGEKATPPLEVKILFRGTHSKGTVEADLESTGAGSKTMRDNRLALLQEVNAIVADVQKQAGGKKVSLSVHGHSLGGALAERFTSELHQAIFYEQKKEKESLFRVERENTIKEQATLSKSAIDSLESRLILNNTEMHNKDYSALAKLEKITTTTANSARLSEKEASIGEGVIALTQERDGPLQVINHFKSKGDPVSQANQRNLGAGFKEGSKVKVALLTKDAGYGLFRSMRPIWAHTDHPLRRSKDPDQKDPTFTYVHNEGNDGNYNLLRARLTSSKIIPRIVQKIYLRLPTVITEPITWAQSQWAEATGGGRPKGKAIKMESVKRNEKKAKFKKIAHEIAILKMRAGAQGQNKKELKKKLDNISNELNQISDPLLKIQLKQELMRVRAKMSEKSSSSSAEHQAKSVTFAQKRVADLSKKRDENSSKSNELESGTKSVMKPKT